MKFDVSKLSDDQLMVAEMIVKEAESQGVNPDLALSIAYVESRFNPNVKDSGAGAMGVMQLMPGTAKDMKVNPRDLKENIRGGITFLNRLTEHKNIGSDLTKVVAAYHMGPDAKFFKTGDPADIGDKTIEYVDMVNRMSGGILAPVGEGGAAAPSTPAPNTDAPYPDAGPVPVSADETWQAANLPTAPEETGGPKLGFTPAAMAAGAIPGATIGGSLGAYQTFKPAISGGLTALERLGAPPPPPGAPGAPSAAPSQGGMPPPRGPVARTPVGGQGTFNYAKQFGLTDFDAARAADMSKGPGGSWDVARQVREAEAKIGPGYKMTPERADLLLPESAGGGPRGARRVPIPPVEPPKPSMGQRVAGVMSRSPLMTSTLGGMSMGAQAAEAAERARQGDVPGAVGMGTGALGSAMTMLPRIAPGFGPPGLAMSVAGPVATALMDYTRSQGRPTLESPAISIPATILQDLKQTEQRYQSNLQKARGATGGFSLPPMQ